MTVCNFLAYPSYFNASEPGLFLVVYFRMGGGGLHGLVYLLTELVDLQQLFVRLILGEFLDVPLTSEVPEHLKNVIVLLKLF